MIKKPFQSFLLNVLIASHLSCMPNYQNHNEYVIKDCVEETAIKEGLENNLEIEKENEEIFFVPDFKLSNHLKNIDELESVLNIVSYQEIIETIETPEEAQKLILAYKKRNGNCLETRGMINLENSFKRIHEDKVCIDCTEAFMIAAATLSDNGYLPLRLEVIRKEKEMNILEPTSLVGHALFLYKKDGLFGYIDDTMISEAEFQNVEEIVKHIKKTYNQSYQRYRVINVEEINNDWITNVSGGLFSKKEFKDLKY